MDSIDKAKKILEITDTSDVINNVIKQTLQILKPYLILEGNDSLIKDISEIIYNHQNDILNIFVSGMVNHYTTEELDFIIEFCHNPIGLSIYKKQGFVNLSNQRDLIAFNNNILIPEIQKKLIEAFNLSMKTKLDYN